MVTCACLVRYGHIVKDVLEDEAQVVDGIEVPVDTSKPNPNGIEFDNLYLVSPMPPLSKHATSHCILLLFWQLCLALIAWVCTLEFDKAVPIDVILEVPISIAPAPSFSMRDVLLRRI